MALASSDKLPKLDPKPIVSVEPVKTFDPQDEYYQMAKQLMEGKNEFIKEALIAQHFQLDVDERTEAERTLENYCFDNGEGIGSELKWIDCACGTPYLTGDDYICGGCRAAL